MQPHTANSARNAAGSQRQHQHVVQFYENDEFLFEAVSGFIASGLKAGQPAIVFARPESRRAFATRLDQHGYDYHTATRNGELAMHDVRETLATFMRGSLIDEDRFMTEIGSRVQKAAAGRMITVRAFGEMVDVLFRDGNSQAAIRLEELWNQLAEKHSFELLCAYAINNFYTETHARDLMRICDTHSHVVPAESYALLREDRERSHKVVELQQRARALEVEIEQRKAIERALRESLLERQIAREEAEQASNAKSEFLAVISHELRTPLTAIIGYEELIEQGLGGPVTEQQRTFLGGIRAGAFQLLRLIDQILLQSRVKAGKELIEISEFELGELIASCAALISPLVGERGLTLNVTTIPGVMCRSDEGKVRQIVLNLLANAVKFTDAGSIDVRFVTRGNTALVDVSDTGIGIEQSQLDRIFEPFQQVNSTTTRTHGGAGLGLSVSRQLARLLGGDVEARSVPDEGSTFTLQLPIDYNLIESVASSAVSPMGMPSKAGSRLR